MRAALNGRLSARLIALAAAVTALVVALQSPASATSSVVVVNNFYNSCDAQVSVSDAVQSGSVTVNAIWWCPSGKSFFPSTIIAVISVNGAEVKRASKSTGFLDDPQSLSVQVSYPDWSSTDSFKGSMILTGPSTNRTVPTGSIRT